MRKIDGMVKMDLFKKAQLLTAVLSGSLLANTTAFDSQFGTGGMQLGTGLPVASNDIGRAVAALADGKLILAGTTTSAAGGSDLLVTKLLANGDIDRSFGQQGKVNLDASGGNDVGYHALVQPDGRILIAGACMTEKTIPCLFRLHTNGDIDTSFADHGKFFYSIPGGDGTGQILRVALQSDGKIVAVGARALSNNKQNADAFALRLTSDGFLDDNFATNGLYVSVTTASDWAESVAIDSKDRVALAIYDNVTGNIVVERLTRNGALDPGFNGSGRAIYDSGQIDLAHALATDSQDRIWIGGRVRVCGWSANPCEADTGQFDAAVLRFTETGLLDTDFGVNGIATFDNNGAEYVTELASADDGGFYFGGIGYQLVDGQFSYQTFLSRLDANGLGQDFGHYPITINGNDQFANVLKAGARDTVLLRGLSRLEAGGIVYAGSAYNEGEPSKLTVAKLVDAGGFDLSFQDQGHVLFSVHEDDAIRWHQSVGYGGMYRFLLGSTGGGNAVIARIDHTGTFDTSFGNNGTQVIVTNGEAVEQLVSIDRAVDGGVVVAYSALADSSDASIGINRYTDSGQPDEAFGNNGSVRSTLDTNFSLASGTGDGIKRVLTSLQYDGTVTVAIAGEKNGVSTVYLLRYTESGEPDVTLSLTPALGDFQLHAFVVDEAERGLYLAGSVAGAFSIVRLDLAGEIDTSFGDNGWRSLSADTISVDKLSLRFARDEVLAVGNRKNGNRLNGFLMSFDRYGAFGINWIKEYPIAGQNSLIHDIQTRDDDKLFLVGTRFLESVDTDGRLFVVRTLPDGTTDPEFGESGIISATVDGASDGQSIWLTDGGRLFTAGACGKNACLMRANAQAGNPAPNTNRITFGDIPVGVTSSLHEFILHNGENYHDFEIVGPLQVMDISASGDFVVESTCSGRQLEAWAACSIGVRFKPSAEGSRSGVLTITTDAGIRTVELSGVGTSNPAPQTGGSGGGGSIAWIGLLPMLLLLASRKAGRRAHN